ncbi:pollen-specific leucine-rich repeat extensin-like protein 3 [Iris pallida]|uniref:Pollen-specific leucine-rich repeat extensin-like protein 3 n=1 Tax=Iris pallida TaxID=29817 RepID=A0AAX6IBD0_IRIPA|nr:pollen-specific leucine-rich repeat extensin-like protein 3 [Iris pallida]
MSNVHRRSSRAAAFYVSRSTIDHAPAYRPTSTVPSAGAPPRRWPPLSMAAKLRPIPRLPPPMSSQNPLLSLSLFSNTQLSFSLFLLLLISLLHSELCFAIITNVLRERGRWGKK